MKDYKIILGITGLLFLWSCSSDIEVNVKKALHTCSKNDGSYSCTLNKTNLEKFSPEISDKVKENLNNVELLSSISIYEDSDVKFNTLDEYIDFTKNSLKDVLDIEQELIDKGEIDKTLSDYPSYAKKEIISTTKKQINKTKTLLQDKINYALSAKEKCSTLGKSHIHNIAQKLGEEGFVERKHDIILTKTFTYNDYEKILKKSTKSLFQDYSKQVASWKIIVDNLKSDCFYNFEDGFYESLIGYIRKSHLSPSTYTFKAPFDYQNINIGLSSLWKQITLSLESEIAFYLKRKESLIKNQENLDHFLKKKINGIIAQILGEPYKYLEGVLLGNDYYEIFNESNIILPFFFEKEKISYIDSIILTDTKTREKIILNEGIEFNTIYQRNEGASTYIDILLKTTKFDIEEGASRRFQIESINNTLLKDQFIIYVRKGSQDDFYQTNINNQAYYGLELSKGIDRKNRVGGEVGYTNEIGGDIKKTIDGYTVNVSSDDIISGKLFGRIGGDISVKNFEALGVKGNAEGGLNIKKTANLSFNSNGNIVSKEGQLINNLLLLNTFNFDFGFSQLTDTEIRKVERIKESLGEKQIYTSLFNSTIDYKLINNLLNLKFDIHKFIGEWFHYDLVKTAGIGGGIDYGGSIGAQGLSLIEGELARVGNWYYSLLKDNKDTYVYKYVKEDKTSINFNYTPDQFVKQFIPEESTLLNAVNGTAQGILSDELGKINAQYMARKNTLLPKSGNIIREVELYTIKKGDAYEIEKIVDRISDKTYFNNLGIDINPLSDDVDYGMSYEIESDNLKGEKIHSILSMQMIINRYLNSNGEYFLNIYKNGVITNPEDLTNLYSYLKEIPGKLNYSLKLSLIGGKSKYDKDSNFVLSDFLTDEIIKMGVESWTNINAMNQTINQDEKEIKDTINKINKKLEKRGNSKNKLKDIDYIGNTDKTVRVTKRDKNEAKKFKKLHEGYKKKLQEKSRVLKKISGIASKLKLVDVKVKQKNISFGDIEILDIDSKIGGISVHSIYSGFEKSTFYNITSKYMDSISTYIHETYNNSLQLYNN